MNPFVWVAITPDTWLPPSLLENLWTEGLDYLYWRKTNLEDQPAPESNLNKIMLASSQPTAHLWHLKEKDQKQLANHQRAFSTSIHQLVDWPLWIDKVELVFYSPVFESISKPGYGPSLTLAEMQKEIEDIRSRYSNLPRLIALGGVQKANISKVQRAGFDGAALLGSLWNSPDPVQTFQELRQNL